MVSITSEKWQSWYKLKLWYNLVMWFENYGMSYSKTKLLDHLNEPSQWELWWVKLGCVISCWFYQKKKKEKRKKDYLIIWINSVHGSFVRWILKQYQTFLLHKSVGWLYRILCGTVSNVWRFPLRCICRLTHIEQIFPPHINYFIISIAAFECPSWLWPVDMNYLPALT